MEVASLELCKELYELSGWDDNDFFHVITLTTNWHLSWYPNGDLPKDINAVPAYDLGYLLRKLPPYLKYQREHYRLEIEPAGYGVKWNRDMGHKVYWVACYATNESSDIPFLGNANTPEDAAAKLAIELFKQGVLRKGVA